MPWFSAAACDLKSNAERKPQILSDMELSSACLGPGRTNNCEVELDVPSKCITSTCGSTCPIVFYLHGAGGSNNGFKFGSDVHDYGYIGVYPQGENGWNTGPKDTNNCDWDEFDCNEDPDEGDFIADIIADVKSLGDMSGNVYIIGISNGGALAHRLAVNAGDSLPIKGIVAVVTQLLDSPPRSGPGVLNYNYPKAKGNNPGSKVSVLNVMGVADDLIPYEGGYSDVFEGETKFQLMSAMKSMTAWAEHNECSSFTNKNVDTDMGDRTAKFYTWSCSDKSIIVEHYALEGVGHGAGEAEIEGIAVEFDLAADFIDRCENNSDEPNTNTCKSKGWYSYLKNKYCVGRVNKKGKFPRFWKIKEGTKKEVLNMECQKKNCKKIECCDKGLPRKCTNTGNEGLVKGGFTQEMCGNKWTLLPYQDRKNIACAGKNGEICRKRDCCER